MSYIFVQIAPPYSLRRHHSHKLPLSLDRSPLLPTIVDPIGWTIFMAGPGGLAGLLRLQRVNVTVPGRGSTSLPG